MAVPELEEEIKYFDQHRQDLWKRAPGKFALIKGSELINFYDTDLTAYHEGATRFPGQPFLIKEILPEDRIAYAPALYTGAIYATF